MLAGTLNWVLTGMLNWLLAGMLDQVLARTLDKDVGWDTGRDAWPEAELGAAWNTGLGCLARVLNWVLAEMLCKDAGPGFWPEYLTRMLVWDGGLGTILLDWDA